MLSDDGSMQASRPVSTVVSQNVISGYLLSTIPVKTGDQRVSSLWCTGQNV